MLNVFGLEQLCESFPVFLSGDDGLGHLEEEIGSKALCEVDPLEGFGVGWVIGVDEDEVVGDVFFGDVGEDGFELAAVVIELFYVFWYFVDGDVVCAIGGDALFD